MALFQKHSVKNIVVILGSILAFNTLPKLPYVGTWIQNYPYIVLVVGIAIIAFSDKISDSIGG